MLETKRTLIFLLLAVTLSSSLLGCQPQSPANATAPAQTSVTIVIAEDPPSFNPVITDTGYDSLVMDLVMLGLTDIDENGNVFPELAAELPTLENGDVVQDETAGTMSVTWKMRKDAQWSDGTPVTAKDVIFTYNAILDPAKGSWIPGIDYIDSIAQVDNYTLTINYNAIFPGYLTQFGGEQVVVWPAHYCSAEQGFSAWDCAREPLSDGPYKLEEWVNGDHMTFVKNENYFDKGKPSIETIIVKIIPDAAVRKTMLLNGDADLDMWSSEQMIHDLEGAENVQVSNSPDNRWVMRIFFNLAAKGATDPVATPHPILSNVKVRQAIRMAIDVDTITKEFFYGLAKPNWTEFFRPPYVCDNVARTQFDLEGAKALLEEAGWVDQDGDGVRECHNCGTAADGYPMEMEFITYSEYGEPLELTQQFIAEQLGKIGIKLNLTVVEGSVLWATAADGGIEQNGNFDMDIWDEGYAGIDPTDYLWSYYSAEAAVPDNGYNYGRWENPEFDSLLDEAYTLDTQTRHDAFCKMATLLDEELPQALLFTAVNASVHSARLQGVKSSTNDIITWNAADWTLK
ncbi:MAG: peptide ABC transporter substrate-binding protein [Anaerolineales bacterium]|nr:peptide ABC transporter substrate-binding protein [Anaerolineales bacterium]